MYKSSIGYIRELFMHLSRKRQIAADSAGNFKFWTRGVSYFAQDFF